MPGRSCKEFEKLGITVKAVVLAEMTLKEQVRLSLGVFLISVLTDVCLLHTGPSVYGEFRGDTGLGGGVEHRDFLAKGWHHDFACTEGRKE